MDQKRGIGKDNKIPWHLKDDLIKLKRLTKDHVVILGRKTYDSMVFYYNKTGRPMPGKLYIVVTHDEGYKPARENGQVAHSLEEAIKIANVILIRQLAEKNLQTRSFAKNELAQDDKKKEIFIIGGGQIFQQALPLADKLYLTIVEGDYNCDTFFPDYSEFKKVVFEESREGEGHKYKFMEIERG